MKNLFRLYSSSDRQHHSRINSHNSPNYSAAMVETPPENTLPSHKPVLTYHRFMPTHQISPRASRKQRHMPKSSSSLTRYPMGNEIGYVENLRCFHLSLVVWLDSRTDAWFTGLVCSFPLCRAAEKIYCPTHMLIAASLQKQPCKHRFSCLACVTVNASAVEPRELGR